jgi:hypothetical protein
MLARLLALVLCTLGKYVPNADLESLENCL